MGIKTSSGFTIVEVMLFLAVTGLMISGVLINATSSINAQQYREGVESLRNTMAGQYAKVYSLTNGITSGDSSNLDPCQYLDDNELTVVRGTSDCFYTGRLVEIKPGGDGEVASTLQVSPVIAKPLLANPGRLYDNQSTNAGSANSSINPATGQEYTLSERYQFARFEANSELVEKKKLDWGLAAVRPGTDTPMRVSLLILRSPVDGTVQTYNLLAGDQDPDTIDYESVGPILTAAAYSAVKFCVADLSGSLDPPDRTMISVQRGATGSGDVETRMTNEGGDPAC